MPHRQNSFKSLIGKLVQTEAKIDNPQHTYTLLITPLALYRYCN